MVKQSQGKWWIKNNYPPAMLSREPGIMHTDEQYNIHFNDLLSCVLQIFQFENMPETIDISYFKFCLFLSGRVAVFRDTRGNGDLRALDCATGGEPDIYYMPKRVIITNPSFYGYSYDLRFGENCAVIFCRECDRYNYGRETGGLFGLISTTANLLADNTVSINVAQKNMRLTNIVSADDDITVKSLKAAMEKMYDGCATIPVQTHLIDKLESVPITAQTNTQQLLQLLQTRQYIYSHFYEQIGLKTHDQMKKERLISAEIDEGSELAIFNLSDMIAEITRGLDECNRIFDTDIRMYINPMILQTLQPAAAPEPAAEPAAATAAEPSAPEPAAAPEPEPQPEAVEMISPETEPEEPEPAPEDQTDGSASADAAPADQEPEPEPEPPAEQAQPETVNESTDDQTDGSASADEPPADQEPEPQPEPAPAQEITINVGDNAENITIEIHAESDENAAEEPPADLTDGQTDDESGVNDQ